VFQDPASTLDPKMTIGESVAEPLVLHKVLQGQELTDRVSSLLDKVELSGHYRNRYPHELSGGQRQRVSIARALALDPQLLIADEPTTALDVTTQARILALLDRLAEERGMAVLFITHDLAVAAAFCTRIHVMREGRVVEAGPLREVLSVPGDDYTRQL
ncbi:glutathione ABC transporter ATP-binding protein, partial [Virgibacillus profundi]